MSFQFDVLYKLNLCIEGDGKAVVDDFFALGLPLKVVHIKVGCIFSTLFSDFRARGLISIPTPPIVALTEFFHAEAVASVHPLRVS